ncbi:snaclec bitiscetin subunit beta-like [Lacerta agilis]|uniref:snaclec bitiscetin subunit beta-like n=1 Tax=Lacerta agilis TaxID=80427 RepID=UPI00141958AF|nr:snaclec bitiscetin subunit beta-like [Lacerta agilis]
MKPHSVLMLYLGVLLLPVSEGNGLPEVKSRDRRFLLGNIFDWNNPPSRDNEVPASHDSSVVEPELFCQGGCLDGWMSYLDQCYMFVQKRETWEEAERTCQRKVTGGHLTSVSSAEHNDFLVSLATYHGQQTAQFWTGGSHRKGSSLEWTDGSGANFLQRPLSSILHVFGEAINSFLHSRICLKINLGGQGNWDGSDCKKKLPFVCSYKPNLTPP